MAAVVNDPYKLYQAELQGLKSKETSNRNKYIQTLSKCLQDNSCPMNFRLLVEAQHSCQGVKLNQPDGQSIRIKALNAATVGTALSFTTHFVRAAVRSVALPLSIPQSYGKAGRYNMTGEVREEFRRTGQEWVDAGVSLLCFPLGLCKTFVPDAFEKKVDELAEYYVQRIDARTLRDQYVAGKIQTFAENQTKILTAWRNGEKPPQLA